MSSTGPPSPPSPPVWLDWVRGPDGAGAGWKGWKGGGSDLVFPGGRVAIWFKPTRPLAVRPPAAAALSGSAHGRRRAKPYMQRWPARTRPRRRRLSSCCLSSKRTCGPWTRLALRAACGCLWAPDCPLGWLLWSPRPERGRLNARGQTPPAWLCRPRLPQEGRTALHLAAMKGRLKVVQLLLAAKADPAAKDKVRAALLGGRCAFVRMCALPSLKESCSLEWPGAPSGAPLPPCQTTKRTPLDYALHFKRQSIVDLLRQSATPQAQAPFAVIRKELLAKHRHRECPIPASPERGLRSAGACQACCSPACC